MNTYNESSFKNDCNNKSILFVCVENAGRSQMAEGFFKKYTKGFNVRSAGTKPVLQINPLAVQVMNEVGIDISNQKPKELTEDMIRNSDLIVNMGCMDKGFCPVIFLPKVIEWKLQDPQGESIEKVMDIRNQIEEEIKKLVEEITNYNKA